METSLAGPRHIRVAGLMNEPPDGRPVVMAGLMGMVKLFVRNGVQVVSDVLSSSSRHSAPSRIAVGIVSLVLCAMLT